MPRLLLLPLLLCAVCSVVTGVSTVDVEKTAYLKPADTHASFLDAFELVERGTHIEETGSECGGLLCPLKKAVCCQGGKHCCPLGSQCMKAKHGGAQLCGTGVHIPTAPGVSEKEDPKCKCARLCPTATCSFCPCKRKVQNVIVMLPGEAGVPTKVRGYGEYKPKGHREPNMPSVSDTI